MLNNQPTQTYAQVKQRLDEIVEAVSDQELSLDDALDLYEEAVKLGMRASELIEDESVASAADASPASSGTDASAKDASQE